MEGTLNMDAVTDEQELAAKLGPATLWGRTVADRRSWLLQLRTLAIVSGHPRSLAVVLNDVDLIVEPETRLRSLVGWLEKLLISDPIAAGAAARELRERMALRWGRWHGWDDEALTFAVLCIGDGVVYAAEMLKGSPLSDAELAELHESVVAMVELCGGDTEPVAADYATYRRYMDTQLDEHVHRRPLHDAVAEHAIPAPKYVPELLWTAGQIPGKHLFTVVLAATLPEITKERYGIRQSAVDRVEWAAISTALSVAGRLPARVRQVPAARRSGSA